MYYLKNIFLTCVLFSLCSCQSNLQIVGDKHKTSIEKWHELAKFSESDLNSFKVKLVASFSLNDESSNLYQLNNFRISVTESSFDINLLHPSIEQKYLCDPVCKQLAELIISESDEAGVLSDFYFDQSEFDLFKFYGDLYLLNNNVSHFNKYSPLLVDEYLLFLAQQNQLFSNINDFMVYLKEALNKEAFYAFINNPHNRFKTLSKSPLESDNWNQEPLVNLPENMNKVVLESYQWNQEQNSTEILFWNNDQELAETLFWNDKQSIPESSNNSNEIEDSNNDKPVNKNNIYIGDIVCHGPSNSFGLAQAVTGKTVTVQIAGVLRVYSEGVLMTPKPNEILIKKGKIDFVAVNEQQQYFIDEIEKCQVFNGE